MRVEIWSDVVCPWCYVGGARFRTALEAFPHRSGVEVVHRSFELDPAAPTQAADVLSMLADKYGVSREEAAAMEAGVADAAHGEGLPYALADAGNAAAGRAHGNTFDVHRLLQLGGELGVRGDLTEGLMRAHFGGEASIFERTSLLELVTRFGLPRHLAEDVLGSDQYAVDVRADEQLARDLGISAVPTYVLNRRIAVSGAQPPAAILQALEQAWRLPEC